MPGDEVPEAAGTPAAGLIPVIPITGANIASGLSAGVGASKIGFAATGAIEGMTDAPAVL